MKVKAWQEDVIIPTYEIGKPEKNPLFLEKRVYQGSSGAVYPHPVIEKISDEKIDKVWKAVYLENDFLKIMILPQLGGRVQMAYDKTKQRHFVYYNQVIKPALVGLTGPWISGGIEFNWPQHHRPSTYEPTDFCIEENSDGSVTVWCSELERMFRTKGMAGFTLHPDKAYMEIKVKLYNGTNFPQTFLWWANPAVKVNDDYQSVFPPDVHAVFDHGKRDVSSFPIAKGTYYKIDYSPGTDISKYKNIPVPTSYMAITSNYNFVGGYENDSKGGLLHVANHHVSPGKKQWTWGNGEFGKAWDRNLTDEDGPYIELMCGVYTDNQPDFSWLMPGEEKSFSQYFMPYRDLGVVKNATKDAMVNIEFDKNQATIKAYTTAKYSAGKVIVSTNTEIISEDTFDFHPGTSFEKMISIPAHINISDINIAIKTANGVTLVDWQPEADVEKEIPEAAKAAKEPKDIKHNEQLYLTGLHLEQYRHATYDPRPYYEEALLRDSGDARCNNALGLWYLRRGQFAKAENYFNTAIETITQRNPNPIDGEPLYNKGLALRFQEKYEEAYGCFHKSVWNAAFMDSGYFQVARLDLLKGDISTALENIDRSLIRNWHHHKARHLKVAILRHLSKTTEAKTLCSESLTIDAFNFGILYEQHLLGNNSALSKLKILIRNNIHSYIEYALDYSYAGLFDEAIELIQLGISEQGNEDVYPLAYYYKAWFEHKNGALELAKKTLKQALKANPNYCFPNQPEAIMALEWAITESEKDYKALYYLGNFWYAHKSYDKAIECWEKSIEIEINFATTHRNLALAYFNKKNASLKAFNALKKAFMCDTSDARVFMELDQLYKRLNHNPRLRLDSYKIHPNLVTNRDDLAVEHAALLNSTGEHQLAYDLIMSRQFHPWEGGEGKVTKEYIVSLTELGKEAIKNSEFQRAVELFKKAQKYPTNLGEGKLLGTQENELLYWLGEAHSQMGKTEKATQYYGDATKGLDQVSAAVFYNDQNPDTIFYQGLALLKLNQIEEAQKRFKMLFKYGEEHLSDKIKIDYFSVSLPDMLIWEDDLDNRNRQFCKYLMGLANLGMGNIEDATQCFNSVLLKNNSHIGAILHKRLIESKLLF